MPVLGTGKGGEQRTKQIWGLAVMAQWIECWPMNQGVAGSIPSQGTCLGCRPGPQWGACERQPITLMFLSFLLLPFPSLSKLINKIFTK